MRITITGVDAAMSGLSNNIDQISKQITNDLYSAIKAKTPVKTGNAKRNWRKSSSNETSTIENQTPYIGVLEQGRSRQAPKGMIMPALNQIKGKYK